MSTHAERCPHCRTQADDDTAPAGPPAIALPDPMPEAPTPFRVHYPDGHTQDLTLHPDGRLTMTAGGREWVSALSFTDMAATSWEGAHIEWNPDPQETAPTPPAAPVVVQDALLPTT